MRRRLLTLMFLLIAACHAHAAQVIEAPEAFLAKAFDGTTPVPSVLWLTPTIQSDILRINGQRLPALRQRYWRKGDRTAWILEKVGKEEPITAGFVVQGDHIASAHVLIYRESRGWEIRHTKFRDQFIGTRLNERLALEGRFDGIAGATLSVDAMQTMARLALYLHQAAMQTAP